MKTKTILNVMMAMAIAIILNGCAGKDGAPGATGPAGTNGNANVTTGQTTINSSNWGFSGTSYTCTINSSNITSSLISNGGAVEVYISNDGGAAWVALSYTYINPSVSSPNAFMAYGFDVGQVVLIWTWNNDAANGDPCTTYGTSLLVNIVAIPAAVIKQHPNTNWKDYSQVQPIINSQRTN
ncbi:MAG TPA: hypothetical protein VK806_05990 [Bacteroidia bacterium]|jgi:hypothetical protein|nr:hypothetical protein [Bacteroidia bacterium]